MTAYEMRISDWSSDVCSSDLKVEFGALRADLAGIGEIAAQLPELAVVHIGLEIPDVGAERAEIESDAPVPELGFDPRFIMIDRFGLHRRGGEDRVAIGAVRHAILVDAARFERLRLGRIKEQVGRRLPRHRQVVTEIPVRSEE